MIDWDGVECFRWISSGGCQISGRVHVAHRDRVVEAHRALAVEQLYDAEVRKARKRTGRTAVRLLKLLSKRNGTTG